MVKKLDAHQHFWVYRSNEYEWIDGTMSVLKRDYLPADLQKELEKSGFDGSIAVQARQTLEETQFLLEQAEAFPQILGVVGWVDLCSSQVSQQLTEFAKSPKLVGVRHVIHDELDDEFALCPDFLKGLSHVEDSGLTYDLLLFPKHLPIAATVVKQFPKLNFVLDHIGKPDIANRKLSPWKEGIEALAEHPNVYCKLSGMVTETHWKQWHPEDFFPYLDVVFQAFGEARLMVGSDWPVCRLSGEYPEVMQIPQTWLQQHPASTQEKILHQNLVDFYFGG